MKDRIFIYVVLFTYIKRGQKRAQIRTRMYTNTQIHTSSFSEPQAVGCRWILSPKESKRIRPGANRVHIVSRFYCAPWNTRPVER